MGMVGNFLMVPVAEGLEILNDPDKLLGGPYVSGEKEGQYLDIDKSWNGIHFLLTGSVWEGEEPIKSVIMGDQEIGTVDIGYGPVRLIKSEKVKQISSALDAISIEEFEKRYNIDVLNEADVYPSIWDATGLEYLSYYFKKLKEFYKQAAEEGYCVIQFIT